MAMELRNVTRDTLEAFVLAYSRFRPLVLGSYFCEGKVWFWRDPALAKDHNDSLVAIMHWPVGPYRIPATIDPAMLLGRDDPQNTSGHTPLAAELADTG